jgi:hypothetical protein
VEARRFPGGALISCSSSPLRGRCSGRAAATKDHTMMLRDSRTAASRAAFQSNAVDVYTLLSKRQTFYDLSCVRSNVQATSS